MEDQNPSSIDGISPQQPVQDQVEQSSYGEDASGGPDRPEIRKRMSVSILVLFSIAYVVFIGWCFGLMSLFPNREGSFEWLIMPGALSGALGALLLIGLGLFFLIRILQKVDITPMRRYFSIGKVIVVLLPGVVVGLLTPLVITGEPSLIVAMTDPPPGERLVAPLAVTLNVDEAVEILARKDLQPTLYQWDFEGDGQINEETVEPTVTAHYRRAGGFNVAVRLVLNDRSTRMAYMRLAIPDEVFEITPIRVVVDEPVNFSVEHLVDVPEDIQEIQWDFDGDGNVEETSNALSVMHTFVQTGAENVKAKVIYQNQTQEEYEKVITIYDPEPLPFDVTLMSEPQYLVSPPPFQTKFKIETEEPLREVRFDYGNGEESTGENGGQTYEKKGNYVVTAYARSEDGETAKLTKVVRVVDPLLLSELAFNGKPDVDIKNRLIEGEVPLRLELTPRSSLPLVEYFWEAPDATVVGTTQTSLQAIYRRPGTYTVFLLAQSPDGRAMRLPLTVQVNPPSSSIFIQMSPSGGAAPLTVKFDASETTIPGEEISGFEWKFGDVLDEPSKRGGSIMTHTYEEPGTYTITLYARTTKGNVYDASRTLVVREPIFDACFTPSRMSGTAPLVVRFDSTCSTGISENIGIEWDFGDNAVNDEPNPIHEFKDPGTYTVTLKLRDRSGSVSEYSLEITAEE